MTIKVTDERLMDIKVQVVLKDVPRQVYRVARAAATVCNMPVAMWIAMAILEKWDKDIITLTKGS